VEVRKREEEMRINNEEKKKKEIIENKKRIEEEKIKIIKDKIILQKQEIIQKLELELEKNNSKNNFQEDLKKQQLQISKFQEIIKSIEISHQNSLQKLNEQIVAKDEMIKELQTKISQNEEEDSFFKNILI
jgi:hypothetical protein